MNKFGARAGRSSWCRLSVGLLAVAAMVSPMGAVSSAQAAVVKASPTAAVAAPSVTTAVRTPPIRMSPQTAFPSQMVTVSGKLPKLKSRTLWLQSKVGATWVKNGFKVKTTRTGYYSFRLSAFQAGTYTIRMMAPRVKLGGRVHARYVTGSRTLKVIPRP